MEYPPFAYNALGMRDDVTAEDVAGNTDEGLRRLCPKSDGGDVVQRMRDTGRP